MYLHKRVEIRIVLILRDFFESHRDKYKYVFDD